MKLLSLLKLFFLISISAFSQKSIINIGAGIPIFFPQNFAEEGYGNHNLIRERLHLFAEVPIWTGTSKNISVRPGFGYFFFNETYESDPNAMGGHSEKDLTHNAFSIFTRVFYHFYNNNVSSSTWYFGGSCGVYLWSKTTGESSWWMMQPPGYISGGRVYDESGKAFFHSVYFGMTGGYNFKPTADNKIHPALEGSFYPMFVTVDDKKRSVAMITVVLGFGKEKLPINE